MMWIAIQWTQVSAGVGSLDSPNLGGFYPTQSASGFVSSLRDFLTDSECTLEIASPYTVGIRQVDDLILKEDALTGD